MSDPWFVRNLRDMTWGKPGRGGADADVAYARFPDRQPPEFQKDWLR